ncbi:molybdopterin molybdotransferase MoeA [Thalassotalea litorea]|uniref:Molybdopterin molybdenumtransferase n=1 Tax=Thalassotalea litorea TaxID=2020715 RepID=A0A5R9IF65_9GAMM|nr:gephyrin-like molybdotransferase Glp [Thalassotalea litorea]TLU62003.1 molybdopterin molybdotransferase MoeA [Thalassotalea litorea]
MVDCCSAPGLMPMQDALANLLNNITPIHSVEDISITHADNRVAASETVSPINVPAHNNSAMDGYAICGDFSDGIIEAGRQFHLVGVAMAGQPFTGQLQAGECIRIMTGAVVPDSANAVEMQENVQINDKQITLNQALKPGSHIRMAGEDIAKNQPVFAAGHRFKSVDVGLLASLGVDKVSVYRKPKVAVFSTGDELKSPGDTLNDGDIYESNRHAIIAMLKRVNVDIIDFGIIADDMVKIRDAFNQANEMADAVISSGGVSVGDADYTKDVLDELGHIEFWKVAMKPGKPFAFGQLPNSVFFGLPGNPVSATVTFHQLVVPALTKMSGAKPVKTLTLKAITKMAIKKRPGRMDFQRGFAAVDDDGSLVVTPLSHQGSGVLSSMSKANCYIVLGQQHPGCEQGAQVDVQLFDHVLG